MRRRELICCLAAVGGLWLVPQVARSHPDFARFLAELRREARAMGISERVLARALDGLDPLERVLELDRRQPEGRLAFRTYRRRVLTPERIEAGRERLARHRRLLATVRRRYGVPESVIVALWGIETNYGRFTGGFPVIAALATLAWEGRRGPFFRKQLLAALRILEEGHVSPEDMRGSWAGAMGQPQFMPTTFLRFAVDGDGDGRRDIWNSLPDVFASMGHYLRREGWRSGFRWGREVRLSRPPRDSWLGLERREPLARWRERGVRRADGGPLPRAKVDASLLLPDGPSGPAFLVYDNFRVLLRWNRSRYFALAVGLLADAIGAPKHA